MDYLLLPKSSIFLWKSIDFFISDSHVRNNKYVFLALDITKSKELEEELRKNQDMLEQTVKARTRQLEEAVQVKSRFLATMSHGIYPRYKHLISLLLLVLAILLILLSFDSILRNTLPIAR